MMTRPSLTHAQYSRIEPGHARQRRQRQGGRGQPRASDRADIYRPPPGHPHAAAKRHTQRHRTNRLQRHWCSFPRARSTCSLAACRWWSAEKEARKMKASVALMMCAAAALLLAAEASELKLGYYKKTCPGWENVVKYQVAKAIKANRGVGAALVRLIFHDCFVRGCDASVLLDPTPANPDTEKTAPINIGLAGFEVIDDIKAALEERCPGTVSCADIVVFAARDASSIMSNGHVHFDPPAGRPDGVVSRVADAQRDLPDSTFNIGELIRNFRRKNFTIEELVILSGAHAIGVGHCSSFRGRLSAPPSQIVPAYRSLLAGKCAAGPDPVVVNNVRDEDPQAVAAAFPSFLKRLRKISFLDNSYYHNNLARIVTFNSDWQLLTEKESLGHVHEYADNGTLWDEDFSDALLKLSKLPLPTRSKGEIRKHCRVVNHHHY